ncbi:MAG: hypothetical protein MJZ16_09330 [Bacteroidales bacterium]|nr:hypothetical protein [Bacteroidales bacterium]
MINYTPEATECLGDKDMQTFYKNYMTRLLLNSESHSDETIYYMGDWFNSYSDDDKRRTAIIVLLCLYRLNPMHVKCCLKCYGCSADQRDKKFEIVESWANDNIDRLVHDRKSMDEVIEQMTFLQTV